MDSKTAIIAGASGLIGRSLTQELLKNTDYHQVIVLVRKPLGLHHKNLKELSINFDDLATMEHFPNGDDVFCCLGTTKKKTPDPEDYRKVDYVYCMELAKRAKKEGAERFFLISSLGAKKGSGNFYLNLKGELENDLLLLEYRTVNIFRPALLRGNRNENRMGEKFAQMFTRLIPFIGPLKKYRPIHADKVVNAMIKVSKQDAQGCYYYSSEMMQSM